MASDPNTAVAIPQPHDRELEARVRASKVPLDIGRVLSSVVTGTGTLVIGAATVLLALKVPLNSSSLFALSLLGGMTVGMGFLTWRWARSLPPQLSIATEREREELER